MTLLPAAEHLHHHHHHAHAQHDAFGWEQLLLAAVMGCVLLLFLGIALFATLSVVMRQSETSTPIRLPDSCVYGSVLPGRDDNEAAQYDSIFFDEDTYLDSGPPSPPSWVEGYDKDEERCDVESGHQLNHLKWSPVSTPQSALASSIAMAINERLAILETEHVS